MSKYCDVFKRKVLYPSCMECEEDCVYAHQRTSAITDNERASVHSVQEQSKNHPHTETLRRSI